MSEEKIFRLDKKEICITSTQIKNAIDLLMNENEILQDRQYELEDRISKAIEYIEKQRDKKTHRIDTRLKRVSRILQGVDKE